MTFFTVVAALIAVMVNVCYLRQMTRARSRSLAELLLLVAFDAGLVWIVATRWRRALDSEATEQPIYQHVTKRRIALAVRRFAVGMWDT